MLEEEEQEERAGRASATAVAAAGAAAGRGPSPPLGEGGAEAAATPRLGAQAIERARAYNKPHSRMSQASGTMWRL